VLTLLAVLAFFAFLTPSVQAQTPTTDFTTDTEFRLPQINGVIRFALNGSYTDAVLEGDSWVFTNLSLNNSEPLGNLTISTKNSDITIYSFYSSRESDAFGRVGAIRYYASGAGEQTVNLGLNFNRSTHQSEWGVIVPDSSGNSVFLAEGKVWNLKSDNTVKVNGLEGTVRISYYGFYFRNADESDKPWVEQHSVALATAAVLAATVLAGSFVSLKARRAHVGGY